MLKKYGSQLSYETIEEVALATQRHRSEELGAYIRRERRAAGATLRKLAGSAGISDPYLSQIERGVRKPSPQVVRAIARALGISAESLLVQAGILDEHGEPDLEADILKHPGLDERQKRILIDLVRSFLEQRGVHEASSTGE